MISRPWRRYPFEWILLGVVLLTLGAMFAYSAYDQYGDLEAMEGERLQVQARVIAENLERQLSGVNNALVGIRDDLLQWKGNTMTVLPSRRLKALSDVMPGVRTLLIVDAGGKILGSNRSELVGGIAGKSEDLKALRASTDAAALYISAPFEIRQGVVGINVTRVITDPAGKFAGLVTATLDPEHFNALLRSVLYAPDMRAAVAHSDGKMFLIAPRGERVVGMILAKPGSSFSRHRASGQIATLLTSTSPVSGKERIMASRTLDRADLHIDKPLVVLVSRKVSAVYADWHQDTYLKGWMFGLLVLITTVGLAFHQKRRRVYDRLASDQEAERALAEQALRQSEERYRSLIEWSPEPLAVHRDGKLIYVNPAAIRMFGAKSAQDLVGKHVLDLIHPDFHQVVRERLKSIAAGSRSTPMIEEKYFTLDGTEKDLEVQSTSIVYDGEPAVQVSLRDITERKYADEALRLSDQRLQQAVRASGIGIFDHDHRTDTIYWSPRQRENYGWGPDEPVTLDRFLIQIHPDDRARTAVEVRCAHDPSGDGRFDVEHRIVRRDGELRWLTTRSQTFFEGQGKERRPVRTIGAVLDVTGRKQADDAVRAQTERLRIGQSTARLIVIEWDILNERLTWSDSPEWLRGPLPAEGEYPAFTAQIHADDRELFLATRAKALDTRKEQTLEYRFVRTDGEVLWLRSQHLVAGDTDGKPERMLIALLDITDYKRAQERIEFLAHQDTLTALPNRVLFKDRMEQAMAHAARDRTKVAVLFLDLDSFKTINDSLGHASGDQLLKKVAAALQECVRETDTVSRQGGDEFLIMLAALPDADAVTPVVDKLMKRFKLPFEVAGEPLHTSISVGIAVFPEDGKDFETLLKNADMAMYRAKDAGKNTYRFYTESMNAEAIEHMRMRNGLRAAIDGREFVLHYQPQIDLHSGAVVGVEALIRWNHPEYGMVLPERFIPIAEDLGLIVPIGEWVLREACRQMVVWRKAGLPEMVIAVNLSAVQFGRSDLEQTVASALEESGLDPTMLELELTESILLRDTETTLATVRRLKALGVKLAIDDFGTGYSSLSYLKRFAVDKLKIDQSFIRDLAVNPEDAAIVRAIIQMANSLELRTIAEGVEHESLLHHLRLYKCDVAQGYHFAHPMAAAEFASYALQRLGR